MAGEANKKAAVRKAKALRQWGPIAGGLAAVSLLAHLVLFKGSLTGLQQSALIVQTLLYGAAVYFIADYAASADDAAGSALEKSNGKKGGAKAGDSWKDLLYLTAFSQILSLFSSWGWTLFWVLVPTYSVYLAWGTVSGLLKGFRSMIPAPTQEQLEAVGGGNNAKEDEAAKAAAEKKKQEKKEKQMKKKLAIAQKMGMR